MAVANTLVPTQIVPKSLTDFWSDTAKMMDRIRQRAYQLFETRGRENGHDIEDWMQAEMEALKPVSIAIEDAAGSLTLRAETPGLSAEEIKIDLLPGKVTIKGNHHEETAKKGNQEKDERTYSIYSEVVLPVDVIPDKATATLRNGILELSAPKAKPALQIQVRAA